VALSPLCLCARCHVWVQGYSGKKLEDNMECEIMQVLLEEARESYAEEVVVNLTSDHTPDLESNVERIPAMGGAVEKEDNASP